MQNLSRLLIAILVITSTNVLHAQCDGRYFWDVFTNVDVTPDILYGNNVDYTGLAQDLYVDFYEPAGDTETERPLVVLAHGGFFFFGERTAVDIVTICEDLAKKGYACASIQYRLGVGTTEIDSLGFSKAVVRGVQDARAAVRFFRKEAGTYGIDTAQIFLGGTSAGGVLALHYAYLQDTTITPPWINTVINELGGLEGSSGNPGYSSDVKAIVSYAGAIKDIDWMADVDIPVASTHGTADNVVPYAYGWVGYPLTDFITVPITPMNGSALIHDELDSRGVDNDFLSFEGVGHVPHIDGYGLEPARYAQTIDFTTQFLHRQLDCYAPLGIAATDLPVSLDARPNPATAKVYIDLPPGLLSYEVFNTSGQLVQSGSGQGSTNFEVSRGTLPGGMYLIQVQFEDDRRFLTKVSFN